MTGYALFYKSMSRLGWTLGANPWGRYCLPQDWTGHSAHGLLQPQRLLTGYVHFSMEQSSGKTSGVIQ